MLTITKIEGNLIANVQPITSDSSMCACDVMQYGGVSSLAPVFLFCLVIFGLVKLINS
jgi:hypothetical protein